MKLQTLCLISCLLFLTVSPKSPLALTSVDRSFDELVDLSELVLLGTVTRIESQKDADSGKIYSYITLSELEVIKGNISDVIYVLRVSGGVVENIAESYPGVPGFDKNERYILFIRGNNRDFFPVVGIEHGVFRLQWDDENQREVVLSSDNTIVSDIINNRIVAKKPDSPREIEPITVEKFIEAIQDRINLP